jgi:hypothetical protein
VPIVLKSGSLKLLAPSGPVQACNGIALPNQINNSYVEKILGMHLPPPLPPRPSYACAQNHSESKNLRTVQQTCSNSITHLIGPPGTTAATGQLAKFCAGNFCPKLGTRQQVFPSLVLTYPGYIQCKPVYEVAISANHLTPVGSHGTHISGLHTMQACI